MNPTVEESVEPAKANEAGWAMTLATGIPVFLVMVFVFHRWFGRKGETGD